MAVTLLSGCTGRTAGVEPSADAGTVDVAIKGDSAVGADSLIGCVLRVAPDSEHDTQRVGIVVGCTNPFEAPPVVQLHLAPGTQVLQVGRFACPGMPGECSSDAYDEQYLSSGALWFCETTVQVRSRELLHLDVEVSSSDRPASCPTRA